MAFSAQDFELVPFELLEPAIVFGAALRSRGYALAVEPWDIAYPFTPVFRGVRRGETCFIELTSRIVPERVDEWAKYGRMQRSETRVVFGVAGGRAVASATLAKASKLGVGLEVISDGAVQTILAPRDLSLNLELPALPPRLRRELGHAWELIAAGHWMEGFEEACIVLETKARHYLVEGLASGSVKLATPSGKPVSVTAPEILRMPLGAVKDKFLQIAGPTQDQVRIAKALILINPLRINVAHKRLSGGKPRKDLREKTGGSLVALVNALRIISNA